MEIWKYAAIAKNTRCIAYQLGEEAKIIRRYHRNRGVGVIAENLPEGKCFFHISPPPGSEEFFSRLSFVEKHVFLSSAYFAPIVSPMKRIRDFRRFALREIRANKYDIREFLRHLRISEYSLVDFALGDDAPESYASHDIRRFWRIYDDSGDVVGYYLSLKNPHTRGLAIVLGVPADKK